MQIINNNTVVVTNSEELKQILTEENDYNYIYFGNDITLTSGFTINSNKTNITIDGTYNNVKYTYTNYLTESTDVINVSTKNELITLKNMNIISSHTYGVVYVPSHPNYSNLTVSYDNVNFTGVELSCNYYGITKIMNSVITGTDTNSVTTKKICDSNRIIIGGNTTITSDSTSNVVFFFNDVISSYIKIVPNSYVSITTNKELMNGTNKLDLIVGHGAEFLLTTGNGFAITTTHGARNVTVEQMAKFTFIEKSHQRVPMWNVYGNLTVLEGASLSVINTYMTTPTDNYNIYFKGTNQKITFDNPKNINIYTKNANILYTNNPVEFSFKFTRINMWIDALDYTSCCDLYDMPILYWYKENNLAEVKGTFDKTTTTVTYNNFTAEELSTFPDISNFSFQGRKILTIGNNRINMHPVNNTTNILSGHTMEYADILVEYEDKKLYTTSDENGLFEIDLETNIQDNTSIKITSCLNACYKVKNITTPFNGELTLLKVTNNIPFNITPSSTNPTILNKKNKTIITVIDSRLNSTKWKLYINFTNPMIESTGKVLIDSLYFKKFDNNDIKLITNKILIYESNTNNGNVEVNNITFSTDKGLFLKPTNNLLTDEDYTSLIIWTIEE